MEYSKPVRTLGAFLAEGKTMLLARSDAKKYLFLGILYSGFGILLTGQVVTSTLTGSVRDSTGGMIPAASVSATNQATGATQSSTTTGDGIYTLPYLAPGSYRVTIEAKGFKKFEEDNVVLDVSTTQRVDATLTPGNVQEDGDCER